MDDQKLLLFACISIFNSEVFWFLLLDDSPSPLSVCLEMIDEQKRIMVKFDVGSVS